MAIETFIHIEDELVSLTRRKNIMTIQERIRHKQY
jgi:hypothetical protein